MKIWRFIVLICVLFILSILLHFGVYGFKFYLDTLSNVTFVVGIVLFLPSVITITGAHQVFRGMGYLLRILVNKNTKIEFPTYRDYVEFKSNKAETTFFIELFFSSLITLVVGVILAIIAIS